MILVGQIGIVHAQKKLLDKSYHPIILKGTIAELLNDINKQSGIILGYSSNNFDAGKIVELSRKVNTIGSALQKILDGQYVKLIEQNNKIILAPSQKPFYINNFLPARYSFYGYIKESATLEPLVNATIYETGSQRAVISNTHGYFNFILPEGKHRIEISYGSYRTITLELQLNGNLRKDIALELEKGTLPVITFQNTQNSKDGSVKVVEGQSNNAGSMNEDDPLQYLYLSSGLQNAALSFGNFQVRGGGSDENLFLLDGNPVYNPTHLLGAISILNPTVVRSMKFYKSDFPAQFAGSVSSVLDVHSRQGNMKQWQGEINAGLLAGSISFEGPLVKDKISLMISGRKNIPLSFYETLQDGVTSGFYDAHFRLSASLNSKNKIAINIYKGEDQLKHHGKYVDNLNKWGNTTGSFNWNSILGNRSFINTSVNYSEYKNFGSYQYALFNNDAEADTADIETDLEEDPDDDPDDDLSIEKKYIGTYSNILSYTLKSHAEIFISRRFKLNTGFNLTQTKIKPFDSRITSDLDEDISTFTSFKPLQFEQYSFYAESETRLSNKLLFKPGLHATFYRIKDYQTISLQPRLYLSYAINRKHKLFTSYSRMNQFLHLVINPYAGASRDLWLPSTKILKPEESEIYDVGYAFQHLKKWQLSIDGYYKKLKNVTNYAEGKSTFINKSNWEQNIELGNGRSYGAELLIKRDGEKLSFQAVYALAWSWRQFKSINNGKEFPYKHDHRHTANFGLTFSPSTKMDITGLWSYTTGDIYTTGGLVFTDTISPTPGTDPLNDFQFIYEYTENKQFRAKSFQRFDIGLIYHSKKDKKPYSSVKAGAYNINGAEEQNSYNVRGVLNSRSIRIKTGINTFSIIPYVSFTIKF